MKEKGVCILQTPFSFTLLRFFLPTVSPLNDVKEMFQTAPFFFDFSRFSIFIKTLKCDVFSNLKEILTKNDLIYLYLDNYKLQFYCQIIAKLHTSGNIGYNYLIIKLKFFAI